MENSNYSFKTISTIGLSILISSSAFAFQKLNDAVEAHGCTACHSINKKIVGPPFSAVAKKYKGDSHAQSLLIGKVKFGSKGAWGSMPMPPNPQVSDDDMKEIVSKILSL